MAQKIKIRRGGIGNIGSTIAVSQGELIYASGSSNGVEHVVFIANADGNNTFTPINKLYQGTSAATSFSSQLNGLPYHNTTDKAIYILNSSSSPVLDLTGNIAGKTVGGALTITGDLSLQSNISASGDVTASNILATGNIRALGNIYIGDTNSDNVVFGADISSSLTPNNNNSFDLGSNSQQWRTSYITDGKFTTASGSFSGSFVGNGSSLTNLTSGNISNLFTIAGNTGTGVINGAETVTFTGASGIITAASSNTITLTVNSGSMLPYYSSSIFGAVSGDVLINSSTGVATIQANSVALGTDTTGDYVSTITAGSGVLTTGASSGETIAHIISVDTGSAHFISGSRASLTVSDTSGADGINLTYNSGVLSGVLQNSAITINGTSTSLGGTRTLVTDDIAEDGSPLNLWYTDARVKTKLNAETVISSSVQVDHDATTNFVANKHIDHTSVTLTAGSGLLGGGTIAANRTFSVDSGSMLPYYSSSIFNRISGDVLINSATGVATIQANSVALGTDTTGDYVASLGSLTGLSTVGNTGEGSTPTLSVSYGSSANTAVQGNTNITINGTANEVEITGTAAQSLGGGPSYTIGLPDSVSITSNLTVGGNLTVNGTTTTVNSTVVNIGDNIIILNAASGVADGGIQVIDATGTQHTGSLLWNSTSDYWYAGISGSTHYRLAELSSGTAIASNKVTKADSNGRLVASTITDDGTNVSLSGALTAVSFTSSAFTANTFLKADASKGMASVAVTDTSNIPDVYFAYSAANGFFATSIIDGGTF